MQSYKLAFVAVLTLGVGAAAPRASAEVVNFHSGNGFIGGNDSQITMLIGPANSAFPNPFAPADFAAASAGPAAFIIANHGAWIPSLPANPSARWISTHATGASEGSTALYAIDFVLTQPVLSATIDFTYAVDNVLGTGPNQGLYINGVALSGSTTGGSFNTSFNIFRNDIGPLLNVGTNTLYINATDQGGPAGLIFTTTIETVVPEPTALALLATPALLLRRRRR